MLFKRLLPSIIAVLLLISVISITKNNEKNTIKNDTVQTSAKANKEFRGVWVSYMDLDMRNTDMTYKSFIKKFKNIANKSKEKGFNALIVQVRPFADAFYDSQYYPYSHLLTGKQGKDPGYDPLKYMCHYAHKIGLEIHAWVNPYRIKLNSNPPQFYENHPYLNNPTMGVEFDGNIYINPASSQGRNLIKNGIREIVKNYGIDGIQFDDYFYPTQSKKFDKKEYQEYCDSVGKGNEISLSKWRMTNVNILISEVYQIVHNEKSNVVFGISPQGNIKNNDDLYADVKSWCSEYGYIDYICPQLYFSLKNPALKFSDALNQWLNLDYNDDVNLYIGIAGYKIGTNEDDNTWKSSNDILSQEIKMIREKDIKGFMFYSFENLVSKIASEEVDNMVKILD